MKLEDLKKELISEYLGPYCTKWRIKNGKVNIYGNTRIYKKDITLPFKIGTVYGDFKIHNTFLSDLSNFPDKIMGFCVVKSNDKVYTKEEIRKVCSIKGRLYLNMYPSFKYQMPRWRLNLIKKLLKNYNKIPY